MCVPYRGDACVGDIGQPVIGNGKPGDLRVVGLIVFGGIRGLPVSGYLGILPLRDLDALMP